jgi:hypothetical protein
VVSTNRISIMAAYLFTRLETEDFVTQRGSTDGLVCGSAASNVCATRIPGGDIDNHVARLGVNSRT